jgi:hypothetical protein
VKIETGTPEDHPTPLPLDASASPGVVAATPRIPGGSEQGGVRDLTGERLARLAAGEADIAAAQSAGMAADAGRRQHYLASQTPLGASAGDQMTLPPVPSAAVPPAMSDLYPYSGMEPTPAAAGFEDPEYGTS